MDEDIEPCDGFPDFVDCSDDLADYNANEADDYRNEGAEDSHLEAAHEDRTDIGNE